MTKTILILAANPKNTPQLRLDQEIREIENGLERAQNRREFVLKQKLAARPVDVRRAMLDISPNIVHFCGHGSGDEGIAFEDETGQAKLIGTEALTGFFQLFKDTVECVVLNACYSEEQAEAIAVHISCVIGMREAIGDAAAREFAVAFYDALGAGKPVEFAYELGCSAIQMAGIPEHLTPVIKMGGRATSQEEKIDASTTDRRYVLTDKDATFVVASRAPGPIQSQSVSRREHLETLLDEQKRSHDTLTKRIKAIDTDLERVLDSEQRLTLKARRKDLFDEREEVVDSITKTEEQLQRIAEPAPSVRAEAMAGGTSVLSEHALQGQLFIVHSEVDAGEFAGRLRRDLQLLGIPILSNQGSLQPGAPYDSSAEAVLGLPSSSAVLVLVTPASTQSQVVEREWQYAINRGIPVIPLLVVRCALPRMLSRLNPVDFTLEYGLGLSSLLERLSRLDVDRADYLRAVRIGYLEVREASAHPERFDYKIAQLDGTLESLTLSAAQTDSRIARQQAHTAKEIDLEYQQGLKAREQRKARQRVVGERLVDTSSGFLDRDSQQQEIRTLLAKPDTRIISVIGRGGIGKTAVVSKILNDLESGEFSSLAEDTSLRGIAYLSTRTKKGISLERIFLVCSEMLGGTEGQALLGIWTNPRMDNEDKAAGLLDMMRGGMYVILLDNIEDLLNDSQQIKDVSLQSFLDVALRTPNNVKLVVTTRKGLAFSRETMKFDKWVEIKDGLPVQDGIEMLRSLDQQGSLGLRTASEVTLRRAVEKVHGVPRALEIIASIVAMDPFTSLEELIEQDKIFHRQEFVEELVRENYGRLDEDSRRVLEALAVFGCPVSIAAIAYLLEPFDPGISVRDVLTRLIQIHTVRLDRELKLVSLHPIDRDYIYSQIRD